jgi:nucleotide-binding universal stress UspA family protein
MTLYAHIGVAVAFSPRMRALLREAAHLAQLFSSRLTLIHAGSHDRDKEKQLQQVLTETGLPLDTPMLWVVGPPGAAILDAVSQHGIDLLIAGALEKERSLRYYLGSVAHNLVREAPCSLMLFTEPSVQPEAVRRIVFVTDFSETALVALTKAVRFAELINAESVDVLRVVPQYGEAMVTSQGRLDTAVKKANAAGLAEEKALLADLIDAVGHTRVTLRPHCIEGHAGYVASQFVREQKADLLVMPSASQRSYFFERVFPSDMEWVLREIPCTLWVVREKLS